MKFKIFSTIPLETEALIRDEISKILQRAKNDNLKIDSIYSYEFIFNEYLKCKPELIKICNSKRVFSLIQTQKTNTWNETPLYSSLQIISFINLILYAEFRVNRNNAFDRLLDIICEEIENTYDIIIDAKSAKDYQFDFEYFSKNIAWVLATTSKNYFFKTKVFTVFFNKLYSQISFNTIKTEEYSFKQQNIISLLYFLSDYEVLKIEYEGEADLNILQKLNEFIDKNIENIFTKDFTTERDDCVLITKTSYVKSNNSLTFEFNDGFGSMNYYGIILNNELNFTYVYTYLDMNEQTEVYDVLITDSVFELVT